MFFSSEAKHARARENFTVAAQFLRAGLSLGSIKAHSCAHVKLVTPIEATK